jgi:hypothetical protein
VVYFEVLSGNLPGRLRKLQKPGVRRANLRSVTCTLDLPDMKPTPRPVKSRASLNYVTDLCRISGLAFG